MNNRKNVFERKKYREIKDWISVAGFSAGMCSFFQFRTYELKLNLKI